ncbi:ABC transporter related protein [Magnetococcus marinus MC-1]|uniref:ABC transporter related protein n=1 Tax=Magnetococcus marinus (strain ATCC BAA-1437 / JCM 17883 / MC-1) TaxID=156889 RepID=A0LCD5_MAGMM|nr:ABC transporter ATP-binding protein [Magnetococcus marinus]ABK45628.1 ABC transporter related protein [Magnetococcus marinus MC-1]
MGERVFALHDLHYSYRTGHPVLSGADFELQPGQRVALTGGNGSGKTTLFHVMMGLLLPQQGQVYAYGRLCKAEVDFIPVRARTGLLFQDADDQLFSPTVAEDIAFGPLNLGKSPQQAAAIVEEVLAQLQMSGYETRITHHLSGGEKRMVALATVLAMQPDVLLLDEPTNALDEAAEARLVALLQGLPQALVVISHDRRFLAQVTQRRVVLRDGLLLEGGAV